jgi:hypothetical protein
VNGRPLLGLLVAPGTADRSAPLVRRLGRWCEPRALDLATPPVAAVLATGAAAPGLPRVLADRPGPVAVWLDDERDRAAAGEVVGQADVVVTPSAAVALAVGGAAVLLPPGAVEADAVAPVPPFVRERWRRRAGLDPALVVAVGVPGATPLPDDALPTALAVAAAAVVAGPALSTALALGTPVVTDAASAARVGADAGTDVLVAPPADALEVARVLAADPVRAAALSRRARRLVERRFDLGPAAAEVAARLGLDGAAWSPLLRLDAALAELGTPPGARPAVRAAEALSAFGRVVTS